MKINKTNNKKGFTLIELLVVIAIIGILASVVLASLNSARAKAKDTAIKANLSQARHSAEIYMADNGNYGTAGAGTGACAIAGTNTIGKHLEQAMIYAANPSYDSINETCFIGTTGKTWAASLPLSDGTFFCVNTEGLAVELPTFSIGLTDQTCD